MPAKYESFEKLNFVVLHLTIFSSFSACSDEKQVTLEPFSEGRAQFSIRGMTCLNLLQPFIKGILIKPNPVSYYSFTISNNFMISTFQISKKKRLHKYRSIRIKTGLCKRQCFLVKQNIKL